MEYTPQDEILIEEKWQELVEACRKAKICRREDDWQFIKRAYFLAKEAHKGVRRRSGEPYIIHPIEVALIAVREIGLGKKSVVAALLHDVVEDTDYTLDDLRSMGFPDEVLDALALLTHDPAVPYMEYVREIAKNPIARKVKMADLRHNSDLSRMDEVDEWALTRTEKYKKALAYLKRHIPR